MQKWIFVTGGVLSGLGKGLVSASVSKLLQQRDLEITPVKCDGYLNVDPGTMNPHEHGEVFVLADGTEVDMDFGHYERFLGIETSGDSNLTSGKVFSQVIDKERNGDYLGETVQMVPHVTNEIITEWKTAVKDSDIGIVEIGGTVGDIENMLYLEAVRQLMNDLPAEDTFLIHTTLVPYLETTGEQKTKPTQHSVKKLRETGLSPDMIVGRSKKPLTESTTEKISLFCDVKEDEVISDHDIDNVYRLPLIFDEQNVDDIVSENLELPERQNSMEDWKKRVRNLESDSIGKVAICGKYMEMDDAYVSVEEALKHAAAAEGGSVTIEHVESQDFEPETLKEFDGVVVPGGFGSRGVEGKIDAIKYCREQNKPLLGLCYGMQLMVVEYARNVLDLEAASEEFETGEENLVVAEMRDQKDIEKKGGTMRLGDYEADIEGEVSDIYGEETAVERHRHRYEVNTRYHQQLEENGLKISGKMKNGTLAEYIELSENSFFIGTQSHPEFTSSFQEPNPLYQEFVKNIK